MSEAFEPKNELETQLAAAQEGRISDDDFMHALLASQVFMPVYDDSQIANFQRSTRARPLTIHADTGEEVLVLFTSPDRAREFTRDHSGYHGGMLAEFKWVLERIGSGVGISLNPGWEVGMDIEADMVQQLAHFARD